MNNKSEEAKDNKVKRLLNEVLYDSLKRSKSSQHRRWFSIGLLLLAPFCGSMAALARVQSNHSSTAIFFFFAVVLVMVGGWQYDKANKEENASSSNADPSRPTKENGTTSIRRIK